MTPHEAIINFRDFLCGSYEVWQKSARAIVSREQTTMEEVYGDWAQANWELLVERVICETGEWLDLYGSGSDYEEAAHSRVFFREIAHPVREIAVKPLSEPLIDLLTGNPVDFSVASFEELVTLAGTWYHAAPPFDHVLLREGDSLFLVPVSEIRFITRKIKRD